MSTCWPEEIPASKQTVPVPVPPAASVPTLFMVPPIGNWRFTGVPFLSTDTPGPGPALSRLNPKAVRNFGSDVVLIPFTGAQSSGFPLSFVPGVRSPTVSWTPSAVSRPPMWVHWSPCS